MYIFAFIHTSVHVGTFSSCTCGYISQLYPLWRPSSNPVAMSKWVSESHSVMSDSLWPHGLYSLQARILEWVAVPFSRGSSQPSTWTRVSCIAGRLLTSWTTREYSDLSFWKPFPSKRNQASLEKWPFPGMQQGKYKMNLRQLIMPVSKKVLKYNRDVTEVHYTQPAEVSSGQSGTGASKEWL